MDINYIGLYGDQISNYLNRGVLGKAIDTTCKLIFSFITWYTDPPHFKVDDYPFSIEKACCFVMMY